MYGNEDTYMCERVVKLEMAVGRVGVYMMISLDLTCTFPSRISVASTECAFKWS
jgi:hypothetical protein